MTNFDSYRDAFDPKFYARQLRVKIRPDALLRHFFSTGAKEMLDPSPFFSCSSYLRDHPHVKKSNPLEHFVNSGMEDGLAIVPSDRARLEDFEASPTENFYRAASFANPREDSVAKLISDFVDKDFYFDRYEDLNRRSIDPVLHYVINGWLEGRDPSAWFDTRFYMAAHLDAENSRINPLLHYVMFGKQAGFSTYGSSAAAAMEIRKEDGAKLRVDPSLRNSLGVKHSGLSRRAKFVEDSTAMEINWIIPDFQKGGGGHMTIFRMVRWLEIFGHTCTIWIDRDQFGHTVEELAEILQRDYQCVRAKIRFVSEEFFNAAHEIIIATSWETAYTAKAASAVAKFYFIQDLEPLFHPAGATALAAEATYQFGLNAICASPWLSKIMREKYNAKASSFFLAADATYVQNRPRPDNLVPRLAAYSRDHTERRAVSILKLALEELARRGVEFEVEFFGSDSPVTRAPFGGRDWGIINAEQLNELYNSCDLGICFSTTNYSLVPQEMMQAGLPVVELDVESTREIFPREVATLAAPNPDAVADALEELIKDKARRLNQSAAAKKWVSNFSWEKSARDVENAILGLLKSTSKLADAQAPLAIAQVKSPKASIVIPTLNGGDTLVKVIDAVFKQRAPWDYELVIVDSGSTDGTLDVIRKRASNLIEIPKKDFQHGRTRNLAAEAAKGDFICFLTQDALPADEFWLYNLVTSVERDKRIAGAFGKHLAWPSASRFTKRDLDEHFKGFLNLPLVASKSLERAVIDQGWISYLSYYSDNNSCLRKSVWNDHPYPEVDYGEDQLWAFNVVRAGYGKAYAPSAVVYHSHDYDEDDTFARARTEANFFKQHFEFDMSPPNPDRLIRKLNVDDMIWGVRNNVNPEEIQLRQRLNACRIAGFVAGGTNGISFKSAF